MAYMRKGSLAMARDRAREESDLSSAISRQSGASTLGGAAGGLGMAAYLASLTNPVGWIAAAAATGAATLGGSTAGRTIAKDKVDPKDYLFVAGEAEEARQKLVSDQITTAITAAGAAGVASQAEKAAALQADSGATVASNPGDWGSFGSELTTRSKTVPKPNPAYDATAYAAEAKTMVTNPAITAAKEADPNWVNVAQGDPGYINPQIQQKNVPGWTSSVGPTVPHTAPSRTMLGRTLDLFRPFDEMKLFSSSGKNIAEQQQSAWNQFRKGTKLYK